jgi:hypothetical protein
MTPATQEGRPALATDDEIAELKAGLDGVTPGPWEFPGTRIGGDASVISGERLIASVHPRRFRAPFAEDNAERDANAAHIARCSPLRIRALLACLEAAERQVKELRTSINGCQWYWPEDDTSSDACAGHPFEVLENCDTLPGEVVAVSCGGVVETRFYARLPPADDATSDDDFEVDEATCAAAELKIAAEQTRRAALEAKSHDD